MTTTAQRIKMIREELCHGDNGVFARRIGKSKQVISRWTGHHDLAAMKPYVAIVDELKARSMAKFDEL